MEEKNSARMSMYLAGFTIMSSGIVEGLAYCLKLSEGCKSILTIAIGALAMITAVWFMKSKPEKSNS